MLPRAWNLAWPQWHVPHDPDAGGDDFHRMIRSKIYRSKLWLNSDSAAMKSLGLSLGVACADHCLQRIQHLDKEGGLLQRVVTKCECPFVECFARCQQFIVAPLQTSASLLQRLFPDDALHAAFRNVFACVVALAGRTWFYLISKYESWPYLLIQMAVLAEGGSLEDAMAICVKFFAARDCCLGSGISLKAASTLSNE